MLREEINDSSLDGQILGWVGDEFQALRSEIQQSEALSFVDAHNLALAELDESIRAAALYDNWAAEEKRLFDSARGYPF